MSNYLTHYGVLGMKWGRRKSNRNSTSKRAKGDRGKITSVISKAAKDAAISTVYGPNKNWDNATKFEKGFAVTNVSILTAIGGVAAVSIGADKIKSGRKVSYEVLDQIGKVVYTKYK